MFSHTEVSHSRHTYWLPLHVYTRKPYILMSVKYKPQPYVIGPVCVCGCTMDNPWLHRVSKITEWLPWMTPPPPPPPPPQIAKIFVRREYRAWVSDPCLIDVNSKVFVMLCLWLSYIMRSAWIHVLYIPIFLRVVSLAPGILFLPRGQWSKSESFGYNNCPSASKIDLKNTEIYNSTKP